MIVCPSLSFACTHLFVLYTHFFLDYLVTCSHPVPSLLVPCVTLLHTIFTHPLVSLLAPLPSLCGLGCVSILASRGRVSSRRLGPRDEVEKTESSKGPAS